MTTTDDIDLSDFLAVGASDDRCPVCKLLPKLPEDRRAKVEAAMLADTRRYSSPRIYEVVNREWGYGVGLEAVRKHRTRCVGNA